MKKQTNAQRYMSTAMVAEQLGVGHDKVLIWITSGELVAVNVSNATRSRWRISIDELDAFCDRRSNRDGSKPAPAHAKRATPEKRYV